ncbi:pseudouridine synthase [Fretibacter rubidus]|uniref:pseudouridine synthase n=1 Tax=Fretibacter rubidus TaxID=570162 RepID=UPI00352AC250
MVARAFTYDPPTTPLDIIYKDDDIVVINKPSGLLSVPGKSDPDCAEARVQAAYPTALTIHRLDMATSGLLVFALNPNAQRHIGLQFEKRMVEKAYVARVAGHMRGHSGHVNLPLICDWPNRPRQMVSFEHGKSAQTDWNVIAREDDTTRVLLHPKTGRSHQLRVHMYALGHPILGDRIYADDESFARATRLQLHAQDLRLRKPTGGDWINIHAKCPF